jgi:hypothetical protein
MLQVFSTKINTYFDMPYRTRPVVPSHEITDAGIRFNVETVANIGSLMETENKNMNANEFVERFYENESILKPQVEVSSLSAQPSVKGYGSGGFLDTAMKAFADHYPLVIRPDDIWILMTYAFAKHVNENSEKLRSRFVTHKGKKVLTVNLLPGDLTPGQSSFKTWEKLVFPDFSRQIRDHIGPETHDMISKGFSTTTASDQASFEITLMAAMKSFFGYKMRTICGIPWIELRGTLNDWIDIRDRSQRLFGEFMPEYAALLSPVLDQFVDAYQGQVDHLFWQSMVKRIQHGKGSGAFSTVSGWINLLYPYLAKGNNKLKSWQEMESVNGPEPGDFPSVVSSVPVEWDFLGEQHLLHLCSGWPRTKKRRLYRQILAGL